jgi:radical SAM-linked protein
MVVPATSCAAHMTGNPPPRVRVAAEFAVTGQLRFLAHHDELRMLRRALVRAGWPLAYSQGFNPRPHVVLPVPRNVGTSADNQLALVDLCRALPPAALQDRLAGKLPADYRLLRVTMPAAQRIPQPQAVTYELELEPADQAGIARRIPALEESTSVVVEREYGPRRAARRLDIRTYIEKVESDEGRLRFTLRYRQQRTARPSEVLTALGLAPEAYNHRLRRTTVRWNMERSQTEFGAARERNDFDEQENVAQQGGQG